MTDARSRFGEALQKRFPFVTVAELTNVRHANSCEIRITPSLHIHELQSVGSSANLDIKASVVSVTQAEQLDNKFLRAVLAGVALFSLVFLCLVVGHIYGPWLIHLVQVAAKGAETARVNEL